MQYNAIPCNTMQYHALLITADGAYHCPVGSIMAIFIIYTKRSYWCWASWSCVYRMQPASKVRQVDIGQLGCTLYMLSFSLYQSLYQRHLQLGCTHSFCNSANSKNFKEQIIAMRIWFCGRDWKSAQSFTFPREVCKVILYSLCPPSFLPKRNKEKLLQ